MLSLRLGKKSGQSQELGSLDMCNSKGKIRVKTGWLGLSNYEEQ